MRLHHQLSPELWWQIMKRYILIIGILALFVIFMMPMAAAAPADSRIRTDIYVLSGCDTPQGDWTSHCATIGADVGTLAMSSLYNSDCGADNTFKRAFSISRAPPSTQYVVALVNPSGGGAVFSGGSDYALGSGIWTDENGRYRATSPACDYGWRNFIKTKLESGYFVGLIPAFGDI